jgi:hypothetical protein
MKMKNVATEEIENTSQFPGRFVDEEEEASLELMDDEFFNQSKNSGSIVTPWYDKDSVSSFDDDDDEDHNDVADFDVVGTMMPAAVDCGDENIIPIEEVIENNALDVDVAVLNSSLKAYVYGRLHPDHVKSSRILDIQQRLSHVLVAISNDRNPFLFRKVNGREVNWKVALNLTTDILEMNLSREEGDRLIKTVSDAIRTECGMKVRLPKCSSTVIEGCCRDLLELNAVKLWQRPILPIYFDTSFWRNVGKFSKVRKDFQAPYVDIECALATLLLSIEPTNFEDCIGPRFKTHSDGSKSRVFRSFGSGLYAEEMQKFLNEFVSDSHSKVLVVNLAVWLDKSPMNNSMSRSLTPVVMMVMNDLTNTPITIGYAPDKLPMEESILQVLLEKGKITNSVSNKEEILKEARRDAEWNFINSIFEPFLDKVIKNVGVDVQVGYGSKKRFYRIFPAV